MPMSAIASDLPLAFPTCIREMLIFSRPRMLPSAPTTPGRSSWRVKSICPSGTASTSYSSMRTRRGSRCPGRGAATRQPRADQRSRHARGPRGGCRAHFDQGNVIVSRIGSGLAQSNSLPLRELRGVHLIDGDGKPLIEEPDERLRGDWPRIELGGAPEKAHFELSDGIGRDCGDKASERMCEMLIRPRACELFGRNLRQIAGTCRLARGQIRSHIFCDLHAYRLLRLLRRSSEMRRQDNGVERQQGRAFRRLLPIDIEGCPCELACLQSFIKCRLIDECPARAIDQSGALLHLPKALGVNQMMRLVGQRAVEAHVIGSRQQCIKGDGFRVSPLDDLRRHEWVVGEDVHLEPQAQPGEDAAAGSETDHADAFARELCPDEFGWLPLTGTHRAIGLRKV